MDKENKINLEELNIAQREAVKCMSGPSLIIAGAGSGKTKVITSKIAYLLENDVKPHNILALTFTNKAAKEMKSRIADVVGQHKSNRLWMGTFHSIFLRFLKENAELIGFPSTFTIYSSSDTRNAIKNCIKELQLDDKVYKASEIQSRISNAKNNLVTAKAYMSNAVAIQNDIASRKGRICDIYMKYSQKCITSGAMDFDDILLYMNILLRDFPQVCDQLRNRFTHVLVDEYQDTNLAQYYIVKKISDGHRNLTVVGDDSQSIYAFRGARIQNILNFKKDYPEAKQFKLEQNYRSTKIIVEAANSLIDKNTNRLKKDCFSKGDKGEKIEIIKAFSEQDEAISVAFSISDRYYKDKAQYEDFAILYRTNAQSRAIEEVLRRRNIPYIVYAGHSFYERAEVKDLLAYLRLIVNNKDDEAFRRIINVPARGIGQTSLGYLIAASQSKGLPLFHTIFAEGLEEFGLKTAAISKFKEFASLINEIASKLESKDAYSLANEAANLSSMIAFYKNDTSIEAQSKLENIEELLNGIKSFVEDTPEIQDLEEIQGLSVGGTEVKKVGLADYLENVALVSDLDIEDKEDTNKVKLLTVHSSKGLEFPYVYIIGMEENLFPSSSGNSTLDEIEEERRLFYVAMTRAEKAVTFSYSKSRFRWGQQVCNAPSRFLREIDSQYLDGDVGGKTTPQVPSNKFGSFDGGGRRGSSPSSFSRTSSVGDPSFKTMSGLELGVGTRIEHDKFGYGTITSLEGTSTNAKIIVDFDKAGSKTLLLKFAKIKKV